MLKTSQKQKQMMRTSAKAYFLSTLTNSSNIYCIPALQETAQIQLIEASLHFH